LPDSSAKVGLLSAATATAGVLLVAGVGSSIAAAEVLFAGEGGPAGGSCCSAAAVAASGCCVAAAGRVWCAGVPSKLPAGLLCVELEHLIPSRSSVDL
jgi:hypothetical protein